MRTLFLCLLAYSAAAFAAIPGVDAKKFSDLVNTTVASGEVSSLPDGSQIISQQRIVPNDLTVSHTADYVSITTMVDSKGIPYPTGVAIISESWQLDKDGNWQIEQNMYLASLTGELKAAYHGKLSETPDRHVLSDDFAKLDLSDEVAAAYQAKVAQWL